jgi:hypothetical protein
MKSRGRSVSTIKALIFGWGPFALRLRVPIHTHDKRPSWLGEKIPAARGMAQSAHGCRERELTPSWGRKWCSQTRLRSPQGFPGAHTSRHHLPVLARVAVDRLSGFNVGPPGEPKQSRRPPRAGQVCGNTRDDKPPVLTVAWGDAQETVLLNGIAFDASALDRLTKVVKSAREKTYGRPPGDRSVRVDLIANTERYVQGMDAAREVTKRLADELRSSGISATDLPDAMKGVIEMTKTTE